jgi:hypothetical protein
MDKYTKILLTMITVSLVWISLQLGTVVPNAFAASDTVRVEIVDVNVSKHRTLPVEVSGELRCTE